MSDLVRITGAWTKFASQLEKATKANAVKWTRDEMIRGRWVCNHALGDKTTDSVALIQLTASVEDQCYYLGVVCEQDICLVGPGLDDGVLQDTLAGLYAAVSGYEELLQRVGSVLEADTSASGGKGAK